MMIVIPHTEQSVGTWHTLAEHRGHVYPEAAEPPSRCDWVFVLGMTRPWHAHSDAGALNGRRRGKPITSKSAS